jgi:hypothetical protein
MDITIMRPDLERCILVDDLTQGYMAFTRYDGGLYSAGMVVSGKTEQLFDDFTDKDRLVRDALWLPGHYEVVPFHKSDDPPGDFVASISLIKYYAFFGSVFENALHLFYPKKTEIGHIIQYVQYDFKDFDELSNEAREHIVGEKKEVERLLSPLIVSPRGAQKE